MTQSAISHQIQTLESHLGQPLFLRINRRVELTDAGVDLHLTAADALERVRHGVQRLGAFSKPRSVILHMRADMGQNWYLPRLPAFRAQHPTIDPWLHTTQGEVDLWEAEVHITLTQTPPSGEDVIRAYLFHDEVVPMAAPQVAALYKERLEGAPLLHDETMQDWQKWFDRAGLTRVDVLSGPNFSDSGMMLEAAARGLGVCLGQKRLAGSMLEDGRLVEMSAVSLKLDDPVWAVTLAPNLTHSSVRTVWEWLIAAGE